MFVSHARTPEELKAEVLSDLRRRITYLDGYSHTVAKSVAEQAKLATATRELEDMFKFWQDVEIIRPKRNRTPAAKPDGKFLNVGTSNVYTGNNG